MSSSGRNDSVILREERPKDPLLVIGPGVADPSQAQDDTHERTPRTQLQERPLRLQPGTLVALTTDGLVESAEVDIEDGLRRLAAELAGSDPAHLGLVADGLLAGANRNDDVALLNQLGISRFVPKGRDFADRVVQILRELASSRR